MADIKMPDSTPCKFNAGGWRPCMKPSDNGWCTEHEGLECCSCGGKAVRDCDAAMEGLTCGARLCAKCIHGETGHVTKEAHDEICRAAAEEDEARLASRTSSVRRMNEELGVPKNLFELLKGDWPAEGWRIETAYYLLLKHDLMGCFPAVFSSNRNSRVLTTNLYVLECVWQRLEPRKATIQMQSVYMNPERGIAYPETLDVERREFREPEELLTSPKLRYLTSRGEAPFMWHPGLIGGNNLEKDKFEQDLAAQARRCDPLF